jgi:hypothetical protein
MSFQKIPTLRYSTNKIQGSRYLQMGRQPQLVRKADNSLNQKSPKMNHSTNWSQHYHHTQPDTSVLFAVNWHN